MVAKILSQPCIEPFISLRLLHGLGRQPFGGLGLLALACLALGLLLVLLLLRDCINIDDVGFFRDGPGVAGLPSV